MSFEAMQIVHELYQDDSPQRASKKQVLLAIAWSLKPNGDPAFPGIPTIAQRMFLSERTVIRAIKELEREGVLVVGKHGRDKRANTYRIPFVELRLAQKRAIEREQALRQESSKKAVKPRVIRIE